MFFSTNEKKSIVCAMKTMIDADGYKDSNEKFVFDTVYAYMNVSMDDASKIMAFMLDASNPLLSNSAFKEQATIICSMSIEKKKFLISVLAAIACCDGELCRQESELLASYRMICDLPSSVFSLSDALTFFKTIFNK